MALWLKRRVEFSSCLNVVGYRGQISARVFPNMNKTNDFGNPVAIKGKPPHRLDSGYSGSEQGSSVDLTTTRQAFAIQPSPSSQRNQCESSQSDAQEKKRWNELSWGLSDWLKRNQRAWMHQRSPRLRRSQNRIGHYHHQFVRSLRNMMMFFLRTSHLDFLRCMRGTSSKLI